ncbi:MAG: hypothetical protein IT436_01360 [Phycisphaerales bacterium]|nr:hypothetical protein [Phycisphaerales bacterium]
MKKPTMLVRTLFLTLAAAVALPAFADPVLPDSAGADPANPFTRHRMKNLRRGTPVTFYPTSNGQTIRNGDGQEVRSGGTASPDVSATVPGVINGRQVNDMMTVMGKPGDPADPGIMRLGAFFGGVMTPSIGGWLRDNGYSSDSPIALPQFLRTDFPIVYYGVDLAAVGPAGLAFTATNPPFTVLIAGPGGTLPGLPGYFFSTTLPIYIPGSGWVGTPVPPGTPLEFAGVDYLSAELCPADLNGDGLVDFSDYLEFLTLYDTLNPRADFNGDGFIDFGDYLEFLNHYDAGC